MKQGHSNVLVYDEGFPGWVKKGYPVEKLDMYPEVPIPVVDGAELEDQLRTGEDMVVLDIRDDIDRQMGWIKGSTHIALEDLARRVDELPKDKKIAIVDLHGKQTTITGRFLLHYGYTRLTRLDGGFIKGWLDKGYPTEK